MTSESLRGVHARGIINVSCILPHAHESQLEDSELSQERRCSMRLPRTVGTTGRLRVSLLLELRQAIDHCSS